MSINNPSDTRPGRKKDTFSSLKTTLLIGGIAATAIGTQLIARLESAATGTSTVTTSDVSYTLELQPIPTVVAPSSATSSQTIETNPVVIVPTDVPTPEPEATEETVQVAPVTQTQTQTFQPRGRSRSS